MPGDMEEISLRERPFFENIKKYYEEKFSNSELNAFQHLAWKKFLTLGLPNRKQEAFRYLPLSQFYLEEFKEPKIDSLTKQQLNFLEQEKKRGPTIVFINGQFSEEFSHLSTLPKQVSILPLQKAFLSYQTFFQNHLSKAVKEERDPFAILNFALDFSSLAILVPPKLQLEAPIQCIHLIASDEAVFLAPRIHLFLGSESSVKWIEQFCAFQDNTYCSLSLFDVTLEENANLFFSSLLQGSDQGWHFDSFRATLKSASNLKTVHLMEGAKSARQDFYVHLAAEQANAELKGISLLKNHRQAHQHIFMDHQSPHCHSTQLFKGVLNDASHSSFQGKIYVAKEAQKTQAYQLNQHLLLKDHAIANSKPNLEIYADDVKASHGATVCELDKDQLFYLKTRGLSQEEAKTLLILSFCREVLQDIPHEFLQQKAQEILQRLL